MFSEIVTLLSVIIAAVATGFALWQVRLNRKAIQAQTFLTLVNTARDIHFSQGMDIIRSLRYSDHDEFRKKEPKEVQAHVRDVVDFLNDIRHMIKHGYVTEEHVLNIYFLSIMACAERLLPWWLQGFRHEHGNEYYYYNFEQLCKMIQRMGEKRLLRWHSRDTLA